METRKTVTVRLKVAPGMSPVEQDMLEQDMVQTMEWAADELRTRWSDYTPDGMVVELEY